MKVYKAVSPFYLETATREGWVFEQTLPTSRCEKIQCTTPLSLIPKPGDPYNSMNFTSIPREELVQVNEPIFILSKELEVLTAEEQLKKELLEAQDKLKLADQRNANDTRDLKIQENRVQGFESDLANLRTELSTEQTARRKLETDLSKIRVAIGMTRYGEILAG